MRQATTVWLFFCLFFCVVESYASFFDERFCFLSKDSSYAKILDEIVYQCSLDDPENCIVFLHTALKGLKHNAHVRVPFWYINLVSSRMYYTILQEDYAFSLDYIRECAVRIKRSVDDVLNQSDMLTRYNVETLNLENSEGFADVAQFPHDVEVSQSLRVTGTTKLWDDLTVTGSVTCEDALGVSGNVYVPDTTDATSGIIYKNSTSFLHNRDNTNPSYSVFLGSGAGNLSSTGASLNTGLGYHALSSIDTGTNNVVSGAYAGDAIASGSANTFIGYSAGSSATTASYNVAVGQDSLAALQAGTNNIAIGVGALYNTATDISDSIALGREALGDAISSESLAIGTYALHYAKGDNNIALGYGTLSSGSNTASGNIAIGKNAGASVTTGSNNICFGSGSASALTSGVLNICIGNVSGDSITTGSYNLGIGYDSLGLLQTGNGNVSLGVGAMYNTGTDVDANVALGREALGATTSDNNVAVGYHALRYTTSAANVAVGSLALSGSTNSASENTVVGYNTMSADNCAATQSVALGNSALSSTTNGSYNCAIGYNALTSNTSGSHNVACGYNALAANTSAANSIAIGSGALSGISYNASDNVAIGVSSGDALSSGVQNVLCGSGTGGVLTTGSDNTLLGYNAGNAVVTGTGNVLIGSGAQTGSGAGAGYNEIVIGKGATGVANDTIVIGNSSTEACYIKGIYGVTLGSGSTVYVDSNGQLGVLASAPYVLKAGDSMTGTLNITASGANALTINTDKFVVDNDSGDTTLARNLYLPNTTSATAGIVYKNSVRFLHNRDTNLPKFSLYVGSQAGNLSPSGTVNSNTGVGYNVLSSLDSGVNNVAVGHGALSAVVDSDGAGSESNGNVAVGRFALGDRAAVGSLNVAVGDQAFRDGTGSQNVALGALALGSGSAVSGADNVAVGYNAGSTIITGTGNVVIGSGAQVGSGAGTGYNEIVIGKGAAGVANDTIVIGNSSHDSCYIKGIYGNMSSSGIAVYVDSDGKLGTSVSAKKFKENVKPINSEYKDLITIEPMSFTLKGDFEKRKHYGFIAEALNEYYPEMVLYDCNGEIYGIQYENFFALLVALLQKHEERIKKLEKKDTLLQITL